MKRYLAFTKGMFMAFIVYRFGLFFTLAGNLLYIVLVRFLWGKIYAGSETIRGLTFDQAFVYLALASSIFVLFKTWTDWFILHKIQDGDIIVDLIRPLDFQLQMMFTSAGFALSNLLAITVPSAIVVFLVFGAELNVGAGLFFFPLAMLQAFLVNFNLDYMVGLTAFYTESLWGISMTKEIIVSALSGALVPLQFFPPAALKVLQLLPFQAVYHIPLTLLTSGDLDARMCVQMLGVQAIWVVVLFGLSRLFYSRAVRVLTVAGG
jgi:ABC-2 type transport system permease protein